MKAWNKIEIDKKLQRSIRGLFFRKVSMDRIIIEAGLTERVIRRLVNEKNWITKRERYWIMLCNFAYKNNESITAIANRCGIRETILHRIKRNAGIKTKRFDIVNKIITQKIESSMINDYLSGKNSTEIAAKYGFATHKTVLDVLSNHGIKRRSGADFTNYNVNYFENIDDHDKAYILGLLLSDGYVIKNYSGIAIQLSKDDGYILEKIAKRLGPSATVKAINCSAKRKILANSKDMVRLCAHSPKMSQDLKKFGMVRNKSKILKCPSIQKEFLSSFCRGLWDGDGSIGIDKRNNIWCKLNSASDEFLIKLQEHISHRTNFRPSKNEKCIAVLEPAGGKKQTIDFLRWMYSDKGDLYLERKYDRIKDKIN